MDNLDAQLNDLRKKIEAILYKQQSLNDEVVQLMNEFDRLKAEASGKLTLSKPDEKKETIITRAVEKKVIAAQGAVKEFVSPNSNQDATQKKVGTKPGQNTLEQFVGENLISKIGIIVTIIGVFIGVKYSIDHNLVSPLVRIITGYILGAVLVGISLKLQNRYEAFSNVLMGGGIAVFYFVTYVAYSFYNLLPATLAFIIMLLCTGAAIGASLKYKNQLIALLGLLGAYAIPVLLSDGSGRYYILFSYIAIINVGIMVLSFRQNWKLLFYSAFGLTWMIFLAWFIFTYDPGKHFFMGLFFLLVFFLTFYITFLSYKLIKKEQYDAADVIILLMNSFLFYGIGYGMFDGRQETAQMMGLFTVVNAAIHFCVCLLVKKMQLADKALFYLLLGLVFIFITIAVPVQFDGNWVTLLWAGEAALLFWIGRKQSVGWYEKIAMPLLIIAIISLLQDWDASYRYLQVLGYGNSGVTPFFNINFISSGLILGALTFIVFTEKRTAPSPVFHKDSLVVTFFKGIVPLILLIISYLCLLLEINEYFDVYRVLKGFENESAAIKNLWLMNYSFAFLSVLGLLNQKYFKQRALALINVAAGTIMLAVFVFQGFILLGELRDSYTRQVYNGFEALYLRYICFAFTGIWIWVMREYKSWQLYDGAFTKYFGLVLHATILSVICNEFVHQMDLLGYKNQYKLGLSIICGFYAVLLIVLGIWKKRQYLRITAIVLFGLTLVKLFFYDIAHLSTISKTIVLIILGALLLLVAFLYNKFKDVIVGEAEKIQEDHSS
ncbi:MAG: DUF2339 domain-containing protein [Sphingobacteriales bacterium]|nr:DUF2339 domain-containing protein [Sphingobacteriales bacterium]